MKQISLSRGLVSIVDDEDYALISQFKWYASKSTTKNRCMYYAVRNIHIPDDRWTTQRMHCLILGQKFIDHKDNDGLNNQRSNLRPATQTQNNANFRKRPNTSSVWKGVSWDVQRKKWFASIRKNGKTIALGRFKDECDAATAYNLASHELFGEFARPNVPVYIEA